MFEFTQTSTQLLCEGQHSQPALMPSSVYESVRTLRVGQALRLDITVLLHLLAPCARVMRVTLLRVGMSCHICLRLKGFKAYTFTPVCRIAVMQLKHSVAVQHSPINRSQLLSLHNLVMQRWPASIIQKLIPSI